jgi:hypothetical protein
LNPKLKSKSGSEGNPPLKSTKKKLAFAKKYQAWTENDWMESYVLGLINLQAD